MPEGTRDGLKKPDVVRCRSGQRSRVKMNENGSPVERAEMIKWWDWLDALSPRIDAEVMLRKARECQHPDAVWLSSLFPPGEKVTRARIVDVMLEQGDDPRAMHLASEFTSNSAGLLRAAEMGYAPAQAEMAFKTQGRERVAWSERASALGNRRGIFQLSCFLHDGSGCRPDKGRSLELLRTAAELEHPVAQAYYGFTFGQFDWRRFFWYGRSAERGHDERSFFNSVAAMLPSFERGECVRILHTVGPPLRIVANRDVSPPIDSAVEVQLQRVLELYEALLERARQVVRCWTVVGLQHGVVKDVRVLIGKLVWEEHWRWAEKGEPEQGAQPQIE
jgi:hypothetical protein